MSFKLVLLTGIIYSLTTPLGVTIGMLLVLAYFECRSINIQFILSFFFVPVGLGIAIHNTYNGNSPTAITLLGVLDCMSAGILICMY